jgi:hypothetical protein
LGVSKGFAARMKNGEPAPNPGAGLICGCCETLIPTITSVTVVYCW